MSEVNTREKIVREADRLLYESGYENTSFATIAETVGISRGNFYHHFKSKDDILSAVIGLRLTQRQSLLERWEMQDEQPASRIRSFTMNLSMGLILAMLALVSTLAIAVLGRRVPARPLVPTTT
ncbi:TetR/AcrR family transcriptional regulator [Herbaspirillum rubrisubalbicans]|uniref:TetR/AcrR family transcriptional regulator n=1 Tax=Herbaspirillum rubrisubalbicans TaxID=80842 RepID=UPI000A45E947|nr:TetR/AcrR family transcriptional regulator [Herbaspirillum rubrisubalbicans]